MLPLLLLLVAAAPAAPTAPAEHAQWQAGFADELTALPDHASRLARLQKALGEELDDSDTIAAASTATAVLRALEAQGRTDRTVVRLFLTAALSADPAVRKAALEAAKTGGDPPMPGFSPAPPAPPAPVVTAAPSPAPTAAASPSPAPAASPSPAPAPTPEVLATPAAAAVAPAPAAAPQAAAFTPTAAPALLKDYERRHLKRDTVSFVTGGASMVNGNGGGWMSTTVTWAVYDGGGAPLPTRTFATRVGDRSTIDRLDQRRRDSFVGGAISGAVGVVALGMAAYYGDMSGRAPFETVQYKRASAGMWSSLLVGSTALTLGIMWPWTTVQSEQHVHGFYSPTEADRWIEAYNTKLRDEIGLTEQDVQAIDLD